MALNDGTPARGMDRNTGVISTAFFIVLALSLARILFCRMAPEVLSGERALKLDLVFVAMSVSLAAGGFYYLNIRNESRLALCIFVPAFFFISGVASYRAQYILFHFGREFAFVDANLAAADRALGFDWVLYFHWVTAHSIPSRVLDLAYGSIWLQPFLLGAAFVWRRDLDSFRRLQVALPLSFCLVCLWAFFLPALGAYHFHGMTPDQHADATLDFTDGMTQPLLWLRQDEMPSVLPAFPDLRLVTFPSWHAAAAAIFVMSAWSLPIIRWFGAALNGLMLAATPVQGSHYLTDLVVGAGLGAVAFLVAARILAPGRIPWRSRMQPASPLKGVTL